MAFPLLIPLALGAIRIGSGVAKVGVKAAGAAIDVAGAVASGVGGLMGGGKSGNVKSKAGDSYAADSPQGRMIINSKKQQKQKESSAKGGMGLAKIKGNLSGLSTGSSSTMSVPAMGDAEATPMTLLSQILGQITTNTGLLSSMLQVLASPPLPPAPENLIDDAKQLKGSENEGEPGRIKQVFSAIGTRVKSITSSLGGVGKFLLKGILGVGALVAFTKYRDNITGFIARTFEMLEGFGSRFANSDDPFGSFLDSLMSTGEGSILDSLKKGLAFVIEELVLALTLMLNKFLPDFMKVDLTQKQYESQVAEIAPDKQEAVNNSVVKAVGGGYAFVDSEDSGIDDNTGIALNNVVAKRIERMFEAYAMSGGRVQWSNVGSGFSMEGPQSLTNMNPGITVNDIMTSVPLFDGREITNASLDAGLDYGKGMEGLDDKTLKKVTELLSRKNDFVQQQRMGITKTRGFFGLFATPLSEKVLSIDKQIEDLKTIQPERVMSIDKPIEDLSNPSDSASLNSTTPIILADSGSKVGTVNTGDQIAMSTKTDHSDKTQQAIQIMMA